jgi:hypothetical protein
LHDFNSPSSDFYGNSGIFYRKQGKIYGISGFFNKRREKNEKRTNEEINFLLKTAKYAAFTCSRTNRVLEQLQEINLTPFKRIKFFRILNSIIFIFQFIHIQ